jgi:16S rRNA (cytidine1402-2'-O)-methyltransferase
VARELTKLHEEVRVGTLAQLATLYASAAPRGEVTVVLGGGGKPAEPPDRSEEAAELARALLAGGMTRREVVREVTDRMSLPRNDVYRMVMEIA